MVRSRGDTTRLSILDHATTVAARDGLDALSIGTLAQDLGLSKSGLFSHFGSKESLQVAILDYAAERFVARIVRPALLASRGLPRLLALFDGWMAWALGPRERQGCLFMAASFELDDKPGVVRDRLVASQRDWLDTLAQAVRIAVAEGHLRPDTDPILSAQELYGIQMAAHHVFRLIGDPEALPRAGRAFDRWLLSLQTRIT